MFIKLNISENISQQLYETIHTNVFEHMIDSFEDSVIDNKPEEWEDNIFLEALEQYTDYFVEDISDKDRELIFEFKNPLIALLDYKSEYGDVNHLFKVSQDSQLESEILKIQNTLIYSIIITYIRNNIHIDLEGEYDFDRLMYVDTFAPSGPSGPSSDI